MTDSDTVRVLRAAHKHGMPPIHYSVLAGLLSYANYRWMCHPGQRALAKLCSVNKDTITASVKWLSDRNVIIIRPKPRKVNYYEIRAISHWTVRSGRTVENGKLSGSTAQFAVRRGRTVEKSILRVNCPARSDVIKATPDGVIGATFVASVGDEPSATEENVTVNESKLAFG